MADKKRVFEGAKDGVRSAAARSAAVAAGEVGDAYTATIATAAVNAVQAEASKGRNTLPLERTLTRQKVVVAAEMRG